MITKERGKDIQCLAKLAYIGPKKTYRFEFALGACGLGGCGLPGSGFTIEPDMHWSSNFDQEARTEPVLGNAAPRAMGTIPSMAPLKKYDAKIWITDPDQGYKVIWELRLTDAVEVVGIPTPPVTGKFSNGAGSIVIS